MPPELSSALRGESSTPELSSTPGGESSTLELSSAPGGESDSPGTEFRPDRRVLRSSDEVSGTGFRLRGESDSPGIEFHPGRRKQHPGTEFRPGRRKQVPPELSSVLSVQSYAHQIWR